MIKLLVGLLKGAVIGGAIAYGAFAAKINLPWVTFGVIGVVVGLIAGRPIWSLIRDKNTTSVISILRAAFGFGVGCGLYALVAKAWGPAPNMVAISGVDLLNGWPLGIGVGAIWGAFLELDDSIGSDPKQTLLADKSAPVKAPKKK